jgi:hypothetical protein
VKATADNYDLGFFHLIYEAMLTIDPAGPAAGQLKTERFRLSAPGKRCPPSLSEKSQNSLRLPFIVLEPIAQVV